MAAFLPELRRVFTRLATFELPVVAAVNGHAIAGGFILFAAADWVVMAEPCLLPCHAAGCYRRLRVTWVTPLGLFTASIWKRSSSPSSPSQSRSPRPSTIGTTTMCA